MPWGQNDVTATPDPNASAPPAPTWGQNDLPQSGSGQGLLSALGGYISQEYRNVVGGAIGQVKQDVSEDMAAQASQLARVQKEGFLGSLIDIPGDEASAFIHPFAPGGILRSSKEVWDAANVPIAATIGAPIHAAVVRPAATAIAALPFQMYEPQSPTIDSTGIHFPLPKVVPAAQREAYAEGQVGTALMALGPEVGGAEAGVAEAGASRLPFTEPATPSPLSSATPRVRTQASAVLRQRATDPEAAAAALQAPSEIVPGSAPTTFQQSGDLGLGSLEREVQTRSPEAFAGRLADQNAARVNALGSIQAGADPNEVSAFLRGQFSDLDARTEADVTARTATAQAASDAIGGNAAPEAYGEQLRGAVVDAETAARAREGGLWRAVDPNGDLTGNVTQTRQAAQQIAKDIPPTAKPMAGEEAGIFGVAVAMDPLSPVQDLIALRSRVSTEMRNELISNGRSASYARLSQLRGAIQDNLATTVSQEVANDARGVANGTLEPDNTIAARIQEWINGFRNQQAAGRVGAAGAGEVSPLGATSDAGADGAGLSQSRGPNGSAGSAGLSGDADPAGQVGGRPFAPTFDTEAAQRLETATQATKERAGTFGLGSVRQVLNKAGDAATFRLPEGRVPEKFFHPGPTGYTDMQALFRAVGPEKALPVIRDYAASSLRKAAMGDDGIVNPTKLRAWTQRHADALRALPADAKARFADAGSAARVLTEASRARVEALREAQSGAAGRLLGLHDEDDVRKTVGALFGRQSATAELRALAQKVEANPAAKAGLRQAVVDYIVGKFVGNTEAAASGVSQIKADQFQSFMKASRNSLAQIFTPAEIDSMTAVAADLQRANRSVSAVRIPGQSNTVQDLYGQGRSAKSMLEAAMRFGDFGAHGPISKLSLTAGRAVVGIMRQANINRVDELLTQAMLHPDIARELLEPPPATPNTGSAMRLARAVTKTIPKTSEILGAYAATRRPNDKGSRS